MNKSKHIPIKCRGSRSLPYRVLKPFQGNLKEMSEASADKLKASILKYGWRFPVFVWKEGKTEWVHDGHGRLLVLKSLITDGYTIDDLPVADIEAKDKREAAELLLALNSRYQSITDEGLYQFMSEMEIDPADLDMFDLPDIDLDEFREGYFEDGSEDEDEDKVPEVPEKPKSKLGDLYQFGEHRVLCGDATKAEDVKRLMGGKKADMVFTDPPYNINYQGVSDKRKVKNDKMADADFLNFLTDSLSPYDVMYVCCSWQFASIFKQALSEIGCPAKAMIVWNKVNPAQHLDLYFKQHELIFYYGPLGGQKTVRGDIWEVKRQVNTIHPTMKPVELIVMALNDHQGKKVVFDPFLGSGSTLIASEKTSRICYGMEIDPHYIDVIVQRWVDYTGQTNIIKNGKKIKWQTS